MQRRTRILISLALVCPLASACSSTGESPELATNPATLDDGGSVEAPRRPGSSPSAGEATATPDAPDGGKRPIYTEILGQSQTQQWFPKLKLPNWQARIQTGSGYMDWRDPNHAIWTNPVTAGVSPPVPMSQIERVVLTIGKSPADVGVAGTYESLVSDCIATIRQKYPAVREILLQPLAAGPNRATCTVKGTIVATTKNLPDIEAAIAALAGGDVAVGLVPLVDDCSEFADSTGHLNEAGRIDIAAKHDVAYAGK